MNNSEAPITFSEIPPERQSSGLSILAKLGNQNDLEVNNSQDSSFPNNLSNSALNTKKYDRVPYIEGWLKSTNSQKSFTNPPPWASAGKAEVELRRMKERARALGSPTKDNGVSSQSSYSGFLDELVSDPDHINYKAAHVDDDPYSIIDDDTAFQENKNEGSEDKVTSYTTAPSAFSPLSFNDDDSRFDSDAALYEPHLDPEYQNMKYNDDTQPAVADYDDTADTVSHKSSPEDDLSDTVSYKSDDTNDLPNALSNKNTKANLSDIVSYRYEEDDNLPDTVPYRSDEEDHLPDTLPYQSDKDISLAVQNNDSPEKNLHSTAFSEVSNELAVSKSLTSTSQNAANRNVFGFYAASLNRSNHPLTDDCDPYISAPVSPIIDEEGNLANNEFIKSPRAMERRLMQVYTSQPTTSPELLSKLLDDEDDELDFFNVLTEEEILALEEAAAKKTSKSPNRLKRKQMSTSSVPTDNPISLPEKKLVRSSSLLKPSTIDSFFGSSNVTGSEDDIVEEVGKDFSIPFFAASNIKASKETNNSSPENYRSSLSPDVISKDFF